MADKNSPEADKKPENAPTKPTVNEDAKKAKKASLEDGVKVLENIDLVAHTNLEQQNEIANNQALFQLKYATIAKCIEVIMSIDPDKQDAPDKINTYKGLMDQFVDIFDKMEARKPKNKNKKSEDSENSVPESEKDTDDKEMTKVGSPPDKG